MISHEKMLKDEFFNSVYYDYDIQSFNYDFEIKQEYISDYLIYTLEHKDERVQFIIDVSRLRMETETNLQHYNDIKQRGLIKGFRSAFRHQFRMYGRYRSIYYHNYLRELELHHAITITQKLGNLILVADTFIFHNFPIFLQLDNQLKELKLEYNEAINLCRVKHREILRVFDEETKWAINIARAFKKSIPDREEIKTQRLILSSARDAEIQETRIGYQRIIRADSLVRNAARARVKYHMMRKKRMYNELDTFHLFEFYKRMIISPHPSIM